MIRMLLVVLQATANKGATMTENRRFITADITMITQKQGEPILSILEAGPLTYPLRTSNKHTRVLQCLLSQNPLLKLMF